MNKTLPNGAEILAIDFRGMKVLALFHESEYVTWDIDEDLNAYHGNYFADNFKEAHANFIERIAWIGRYA